jgi:quaternary ammonium compound-resistance protein SugE
MAWVYLAVAGLFEIVWAIALKYADGFTRFWPSAAAVVGMVLSVVLLELSLRTLPVGTAYAVWTGIGTVGAAILGMVLFQEPATAVRIGCIGLIVCGIAGLKLFA